MTERSATRDMKAKPWLDFVYPEDRAATIAAANQLSESQSVIAFKNRYLCKDSSWRWISWNSYPLTDEKLIYGVARDVTEQMQAENEIRKLKD